MIICTDCKTENRDNARYCQKCGATLPEPNPQVGQETTIVLPAGKPAAAAAAATVTQIVPPANGPATQPLTPPPPFTPLPDGALLAPPAGKSGGGPAGEYQVRQIKNESERLNLYTVVGVGGERACSQCGFLHNPAGENYCRYCGSDISSVAEAHLHYLAKESPARETFGIEFQLATLGLHMPQLRLPTAAFTRRVGGGERHYIILPPPPAAWLDSVQPPIELPKALDWGVTLAHALATLHEQQVAFGAFESRRVGVEAGKVSLVEFSGCFIPGREQRCREDVRDLANWIYFLATGQQKYDERANLPQPVKDILGRAINGDTALTSAPALASALDELLANIRRPRSVDFVTGRRTDVGQARQLNEDSLLTLDLVRINQSISEPLGVFAVADGMGGHAAGEIASGLALQALARTAVADLLVATTGSSTPPDYAGWLKKAITAANKAVHDEVRASRSDMGTTLVVALVAGDVAHVANVGDSRAYRINAEGIEQISVDHSLVERLVATGQISREEARHHPQRNVIYRTIGDKSNVEMDTWQVQLRPGDSLLLCSDGLSGMINDETIYQIVTNAPSPQAACDQLVAAANQAGGDDNITAVLVCIAATA